MVRFLYFMVEGVARIHDKLLQINDSSALFLTDKQLHFAVMGLLGMGLLLVIYPLFVFAAKRLRTIGLILSLVIIAAATVLAVTGERSVYNTVLLVNNGSQGVQFDGSYEASLEDESFGEVTIEFNENIQDHMVKASFRKTGETKLILKAPDGTERVFRIDVHKSSVDIAEITDGG